MSTLRASHLKRLGITVIHLITPSVRGRRESRFRCKQLTRAEDHLAVILPFEVALSVDYPDIVM